MWKCTTFTTTPKRSIIICAMEMCSLSLLHFSSSRNYSSPALTVPLARVETLTTKYSSQIKATLNTTWKKWEEKEKQEDVQRHAPKHTGHHSSYTHTAWYTQFSLSEHTSQALFKCMECVGVWSSNRNKKLRSWAHTQTHLAGWLETEMRPYRRICTHLFTHDKDISLVW